MSARTIESWDIDDWLQSLGIDPDCDTQLSQVGAGWQVQVRIPDGVESDEYLCGLEAACDQHFGWAAPIGFEPWNREVFNIPREWIEDKPIGYRTWTGASPSVGMHYSSGALTAAAVKAALEGIKAAVEKEMLDALAIKIAATPTHLLHAKGPRNKWGGAKGARQ